MSEEDTEIAVRELQYFLNDGIGGDMSEHIRTILNYVTELKSDIADLRNEVRRGGAWGGRGDGWVGLYAHELDKPKPELPNDRGPYTIIYMPKGES